MRKYRVLALALLAGALCSSEAYAQQHRIAGKVTATTSGESLANVAVTVVGTTIGTYTADDGSFQLLAPPGDQTLLARRVGFKRSTIRVASTQDQVAIALERDILQLEEQVVTGTATAVSSVNAANAVAVVSGEKLNRVPAQTIDNALQGKVAGATITQNSGAPGGGTQIQVRGVSTINASFSPLYVVDGVIIDNSAIANGLNAITQAAGGTSPSSQDQRVNRSADINPNDIESIQILKGPSASSIYGSRGSNGVILITTKRGRAGKTTFDLAQRFGSASIAHKLDLRCFKSGTEVDDAGFDSTGFGAATNKCHDYQQELYGEHPFNYQTVGSLRGATASGTNFFVSGLVQHDGGLVHNDNYNKQSVRVNLGQQLGSRLNLRANTEIIHSLTERGVSGNDNTGINPYTTFSVTPSFLELRRRPNGVFPVGVGSVQGNNPFQVAELVKTPENVYRLLGSGTGTLNILTGEKQTLDFIFGGGVDSYSDNSKIISPSTLYIEQATALPGTLVNSQGNVVNANLGGSLNHRYTTSAFQATTSAGFGQNRRQIDILATTGHGVFPGVTNVTASTQVVATESQDIVKSMSYFAQEEFLTLSERLLLTAGVNSERTSNNGDPRQFHSYPKFSASYRLPWLPPVTDELKLRLAYGRAGNQPTQGKYTLLTNLIEEGTSGYRASTVRGAAAIRPEQSTETEGGVDLTVFGGRARLSATQFRKQIDELLLQATLAPSTGFASQWINGGQIVTHGTEVELAMTPVQMGGVEWISTTTYASNKGKVTQLPVPAFIPASGSFGSRFGNAFVQQGQLITVLQAVDGCRALNAAGDRCASANRILKFVGNSAPDYQMGFNNDVNVGPFRFSSLVDWRKGGLGINLTNNYFDGEPGSASMLADTAVSAARIREFRKGRAVYVEPAGFVKLREVTVGYELPADLTGRLFAGRVSTARIDLSGRNLKTWTRYSGLDPEVSNFGNQALGRFQDVTPYPPSRLYYLTVNTTF